MMTTRSTTKKLPIGSNSQRKQDGREMIKSVLRRRQQRDEEIRTYLKNLENGTLNEKPKRPLVQIKIDNIFLQANGKKKRGWTKEDAYNSGIFIRWQMRQLYIREYLAREKLIKKPRPSRISAATSKSSK